MPDLVMDTQWDVDLQEPQRILDRIKPLLHFTPSGCWEWQGRKTPQGYAYVGGESTKLVHRLMWEVTTGQTIPKGYFVCHKCDNRPCLNPEHLFCGTRSDNMRDCAAKGRLNTQINRGSMAGENNPSVKTSQADVQEIRRLHDGGNLTMGEIADRFGIPYSRVQRIVKRKSWRCLQ